MRGCLIPSAIILTAAGLGGWQMLEARAQAETTAQAFDIAAGEELYQRYCASCHGADLQGQPDWQSPGADGVLPAPPHDETGHTWHHADDLLFDYTKVGGAAALARKGIEFQSGMPGVSDQLSDAQLLDILAYIKSTWPERQRAVQAERSAAERP